jgi:hypothetical protein
MRNAAFQNWRREREAIEQEMDLLITAGLPASNEERQVRRIRFAALLERREAAARNLLHSGWTGRDKSPGVASRPGDLLVSASHAGAGADEGQATFVPLPDGRRTSELPVHVTTAASAFDAVALALDPGGLRADSDTVATAGVAADEPPSDVVALAPDASAPTDSGEVPAIGLAADIAESPPEKAASPEEPALAPDVMDELPEVATVTAAALSDDVADDVAEPSTETAALAPDTPAVLPDSAAGLPADAVELPADDIALAPDATARLPDQAFVTGAGLPTDAPAGLPTDAATPATEKVALAPDAAASSTGSAGLFAHSVAVAPAADAAPLAGEAKVPSSPPSDDPHSDALLMKLLRRLRPN